jgi:hypothetical protein
MAKMICTVCGTAGEPKTITKGSTLIELILWLCFLIPGLLYSIWRLTSRHKACAACGNQNLVPPDSPIGKKIVTELHPGEDLSSGAEKFGRKLGSMLSKK